MLLSVVQTLFSFWWQATAPTTSPELNFHLRQFHAISNTSPKAIFQDASPPNLAAASYTLPTKRLKIHRPNSHVDFLSARLRSRDQGQSEMLRWNEVDVLGPDVSNRLALVELGKMASNAYYPIANASGWYSLGDDWNSRPHGWEPEDNGLRGQLFVSLDNSHVVITIKGTSITAFLGGEGGPTTKKDKINDNRLFSCCCARVDWSWSTVCPCYSGGWKCDQGCLEESLVSEGSYYPLGIDLYNNITYMYPDSTIWVVGHSLGGSMASLIGSTFGAPVVAFEAPGERMAARRLHLPSPPSTQHIVHVYNTADPAPMGTCTGPLSTCAIAGFAFESKCHLGKTILYDTISTLNWSSSVTAHRMKTVVDQILSLNGTDAPWHWTDEDGVLRDVPPLKEEVDCVDCFSWEFGQHKSESAR